MVVAQYRSEERVVSDERVPFDVRMEMWLKSADDDATGAQFDALFSGIEEPGTESTVPVERIVQVITDALHARQAIDWMSLDDVEADAVGETIASYAEALERVRVAIRKLIAEEHDHGGYLPIVRALGGLLQQMDEMAERLDEVTGEM